MEAVQIIRIEYFFKAEMHTHRTKTHKVIAWKYKLIFNNDMSRASLTAMAGLIVIAIMVSNSAALQRIPKLM